MKSLSDTAAVENYTILIYIFPNSMHQYRQKKGIISL